MSLGKRIGSKILMGTSSPGSGNEELSVMDKKPNVKKTKRFVKKKGETRKRNSNDANAQELVSDSSTISGRKDSTEMVDKISEKFDKIVIKNEMEDSELRAANGGNDGLKIRGDKCGDDNNEGGGEKSLNKKTIEKMNVKKIMRSGKNYSAIKKDELNKVDEPVERNVNKMESKSRSKVEKESMIELVNNKSEGKASANNVCAVETESVQRMKKNGVDEGKTEEKRKRDRQTARFAKAVAKFSMKFVEAAKELGIVRPANGDSSSWSDTSGSSWTDSSSSSSCSCSDCCTTDSSTCSCSDCCSQNCSTCSPSSSKSDSSGTSSCSSSSLTSSKSSSFSTTCTSTSGKVFPRYLISWHTREDCAAEKLKK